MLKTMSVACLSLIGALALLIVFNPDFAVAGDGAAPRTMTLTGNGIASGKPDIATINLGVSSEAKTATAALADNNTKMTRILASLKAAGIKEKDIQTSQFSVSPRYVREKFSSSRGNARIDGYIVSNQVHVIVRDLEKFGEILDTAIGDGSNSMGGISFEFSNPEPLVDAARINAVKDARRKAELYAEAAGVTLGAIVNFQDQSGGSPRPMHARAEMDGFNSVPIAVGESQLSASITITYELK